MESQVIKININDNVDSAARISDAHMIPSILLKSSNQKHTTRGYRSIRIKSTRVVEEVMERQAHSSRILEEQETFCCSCFFAKKPTPQVAVHDYWQYEIQDRLNEIITANKDIAWLTGFQSKLKSVF